MVKFTIFFVISLFLSFFSFSQNTILGNYGEPVDKVPGDTVVPTGQFYFNEGFRMPATRYEEHIMKKAARLSLSRKEVTIYYVMQNPTAKKKFSYYLRYPFIKQKYKKLAKLQGKSLKSNKKKKTKGKLSIEDKESIATADSIGEQNLTPEQKKKYKKALRHQKKVERYKKRHQVDTISRQDSLLVKQYRHSKAYKSDTTKFTRSQKKQLREIKRKQKKLKKEHERQLQAKIDSALEAGASLPVEGKKYRFRRFWYNTKKAFRKKFNSKEAPSSYMKKVERIERRYRLTKRQDLAYKKYISHKELTPSEKRSAKRAYTKEWLKKQKLKKLEEKERKKLMPKWDRKMKKKRKKHSKKTNESMFGKRK